MYQYSFSISPEFNRSRFYIFDYYGRLVPLFLSLHSTFFLFFLSFRLLSEEIVEYIKNILRKSIIARYIQVLKLC